MVLIYLRVQEALLRKWCNSSSMIDTSLDVRTILDWQYFPTLYRGTSLITKCTPLGPYSRTMPRVLGGS
jgi:hypothetical protein